MARSIKALDIDLLCISLRSKIRMIERIAKQAGYSDAMIETLVEGDAALLNRVQLRLEATEVTTK